MHRKANDCLLVPDKQSTQVSFDIKFPLATTSSSALSVLFQGEPGKVGGEGQRRLLFFLNAPFRYTIPSAEVYTANGLHPSQACYVTQLVNEVSPRSPLWLRNGEIFIPAEFMAKSTMFVPGTIRRNNKTILMACKYFWRTPYMDRTVYLGTQGLSKKFKANNFIFYPTAFN